MDWAYFCWNWKHCSEIIFKYVNSIVRPIFNENVTEKWNLWDSWTVYLCTIHSWLGQIMRLEPKKKKKMKRDFPKRRHANAESKRAPTTTPTFTDIYSNSNCQASSVHYFQTPLTTLRGSGQSEKQPFPYSKLYYICTVKWRIRNRITWASKWCNQITCGLIGT